MNNNVDSISVSLRSAAVTPSDSTDLPFIARWLWIGGAGAGNLSFITAGGDTTTLASVPTGRFDGVAIRRVRSTGTDVTNIVAFY